MTNDRKQMKPVETLEKRLEALQKLYDKNDNNPVIQSRVQKEIADCIRQLQLWDQLKSVGK